MNAFKIGTKKVSVEKLQEVIETREPKGFFYGEEGGVYVGVDNSGGDAWTEEFRTEEQCLAWLENGIM